MKTTLLAAFNIAFDGSTEWSVIRYGVYPNAVGLQVFDRPAAQAIHTAFNAKVSRLATLFRGEPLYVGHPDQPEWAAKNPGVRTAAVGRIRETKVDDAGLHLRFAYNEDGKRLVGGDAPAYESFSPVWGMEPITYQGRKAYRPVELYSAGLTNHPNIPGTIIGLNEQLSAEKFPVITTNPTMKTNIIALLAALGITRAADASDEQLVTGINEALAPAKAGASAVAELATAKPALVTATNELALLKPKLTAAEGSVTTAVNEAAELRKSLAAERAARAGVVLTVAVNEGRITAAQKPEWLGKFTAAGADFGVVETDLRKLKVAVNTHSKTGDLGSRRGDPASKSRITAINEAVAAHKLKTGQQDHVTAYNAVREAQPALFAAE